jgi:hypothetical protein
VRHPGRIDCARPPRARVAHGDAEAPRALDLERVIEVEALEVRPVEHVHQVRLPRLDEAVRRDRRPHARHDLRGRAPVDAQDLGPGRDAAPRQVAPHVQAPPHGAQLQRHARERAHARARRAVRDGVEVPGAEARVEGGHPAEEVEAVGRGAERGEERVGAGANAARGS